MARGLQSLRHCLLLRAAFALSPLCPQVSAKQVGFSEIGFGLLTVLALAFGYALRW